MSCYLYINNVFWWKMTDQLERAPTSVKYETGKRYERYVFDERYSDKIVKLSQVRGEQNIVRRELVDDIRVNGLLNPIDVAVISEQLLSEYVEFVRKTWGDAADLRDFDDLKDDDGNYTLLIAGHSRHQAIEDIEDQDFLESGQMVRHPILVKVHSVESVWDIIRIQLGENIHSQPPKERQAIALVEAYEYGELEGRWSSIDEFIESGESDGVSHSAMKKAMQFRKLPSDIRSYVLSGPVHYYAGIELAQSAEPIRRYYIAKLGINDRPSEEQQKTLDTLVSQELAILANRTVKDRMNSTAAKNHIKSRRKHFIELRTAITGESRESAKLDLDFVTEDMGAAFVRENEARLAQQLRDMAKIKDDDVTRLIMLAGGKVDSGVIEECLARQVEQAKKTIERSSRVIGSRATMVAEHDLLLEI